MTRSSETKCLKALYFDLSVCNLKKYYSKGNPNRVYRQIRDYLLENNFPMNSILVIIQIIKQRIWKLWILFRK